MRELHGRRRGALTGVTPRRARGTPARPKGGRDHLPGPSIMSNRHDDVVPGFVQVQTHNDEWSDLGRTSAGRADEAQDGCVAQSLAARACVTTTSCIRDGRAVQPGAFGA